MDKSDFAKRLANNVLQRSADEEQPNCGFSAGSPLTVAGKSCHSPQALPASSSSRKLLPHRQATRFGNLDIPNQNLLFWRESAKSAMSVSPERKKSKKSKPW
jgi:hypothetical protein